MNNKNHNRKRVRGLSGLLGLVFAELISTLLSIWSGSYLFNHGYLSLSALAKLFSLGATLMASHPHEYKMAWHPEEAFATPVIMMLLFILSSMAFFYFGKLLLEEIGNLFKGKTKRR